MACRRPEETSTDYADYTEQAQEQETGARNLLLLLRAPAPVLMSEVAAQFRISS